MTEKQKTEGRAGCPRYHACSVQLCPMAPEGPSTWFADEPVCPLREFAGLRFIKAQKRIARVAGFEAGSFTRSMLESLGAIRRGVTGVNPETFGRRDLLVAAWLERHKLRAPVVLSAEEKARRAERARNLVRARVERRAAPGLEGARDPTGLPGHAEGVAAPGPCHFGESPGSPTAYERSPPAGRGGEGAVQEAHPGDTKHV